MQPLYATALCNRLWKWYATALCNPVKLPKTICNRFRQPLMETVGNRLSSYLPCYATAYGNGMQPLYATPLSYPKPYVTALGNRLWKR